MNKATILIVDVSAYLMLTYILSNKLNSQTFESHPFPNTIYVTENYKLTQSYTVI